MATATNQYQPDYAGTARLGPRGTPCLPTVFRTQSSHEDATARQNSSARLSPEKPP